MDVKKTLPIFQTLKKLFLHFDTFKSMHTLKLFSLFLVYFVPPHFQHLVTVSLLYSLSTCTFIDVLNCTFCENSRSCNYYPSLRIYHDYSSYTQYLRVYSVILSQSFSPEDAKIHTSFLRLVANSLLFVSLSDSSFRK